MEQDSQIKMLQTQLDDYRAREVKSMGKQEKYLEREDKLLQKLDEISSCRQQTTAPQASLPLNRTSMIGNVNQLQASECLQGYVPQNPSVAACQPHFVWDSTEVPTSMRLHHLQPAPHPTLQNTATEAFNFNMQAPNYRQAAPVVDYQYQPLSNLPASESVFRGQGDAVVPSVNVQYQASAPNQQAHPTATIAPMRSASNQDQQPVCQQERNITEPVISKGIGKQIMF